ncbi:MAG TPA: SprT family zinc-dependent metalloprotease [Thermoanaerobaculia bacterium]|nr:SprT family zinc-dependent metalloprotease [Thermoanaerobaculia bacterium]
MTPETERSSVRFGTTIIPYVVQRGRRVKTVAIAVDREGVLVRAPAETPLDRLDEIVRGKARWVAERLRRFRELPPAPSAREFVSGETFLYLGRQARLRVEPAGEGGKVRLASGRLIVPIAPELAGRHRAAAVRKKLVVWYRAHAAIRLPERVEPWRARLELPPAGGVLIRSQEKRWASCDVAGVLRFNWRIVQAPVSLIDYVVAHELIHLRHRHHTPEFWAALGRVLPDYEERREALRQIGERLVW